jgi:hypothetical protein
MSIAVSFAGFSFCNSLTYGFKFLYDTKKTDAARITVYYKLFLALLSLMLLQISAALAQMQYQPTMPPQTPILPPQQMYPGTPGQAQSVPPNPPQGQGSVQYAFRPDLSNPEYGQCLQMEKQWKALYQRYYQEYERIRLYGYQQGDSGAYLQSLRQQMDAAWNNFSSRCVYFPKQKP